MLKLYEHACEKISLRLNQFAHALTKDKLVCSFVEKKPICDKLCPFLLKTGNDKKILSTK